MFEIEANQKGEKVRPKDLDHESLERIKKKLEMELKSLSLDSEQKTPENSHKALIVAVTAINCFEQDGIQDQERGFEKLNAHFRSKLNEAEIEFDFEAFLPSKWQSLADFNDHILELIGSNCYGTIAL